MHHLLQHVLPRMFKEVYEKTKEGTAHWNSLVAPEGALYPWDDASTYIHNPPFFQTMVSSHTSPGASHYSHLLIS